MKIKVPGAVQGRLHCTGSSSRRIRSALPSAYHVTAREETLHRLSTPYDTTSILNFITERFGLQPLPGVRERMGDLSAALD